MNLTRYHGVFAPNSPWRGAITLGGRGRGNPPKAGDGEQGPPFAARRSAMSWAQRLKRVFMIDIETCPACGGAVRIIASIEDPEVIRKILVHIGADVHLVLLKDVFWPISDLHNLIQRPHC